ncbi:hypothetical protein ACFU44_02080 [Nocardia rhizosphaerihabitans]|uniref:hypothetical protein n=1 Tax=Nocardia rhizosphaerihabitans TaxID=1691570 RepID=UPI0036701373
MGTAAVTAAKAGKLALKMKIYVDRVIDAKKAAKFVEGVTQTGDDIQDRRANLQRLVDLFADRVEVAKRALGAKGPQMKIDEAQFGDKVGKHAQDYGLDPADANSRAWLRQHFNDIRNNPDEVRQGSYHPNSGGGSDYWFYKKGDDLLIMKNDGSFVTSFPAKDGNSWFNAATPQ